LNKATVVNHFNWKDSIDGLGLIVQRVSRDGGDTAQRMGMFWIGYYLHKKLLGKFYLNRIPKLPSIPPDALVQLECAECEGDYVRHPRANAWFSDCDRMSRDQNTGIVSLFLAEKIMDMKNSHSRSVWKWMWNHVKRFGFCSNRTRNWIHRKDKEYEELVGKSFPDWLGLQQWTIGLRSILGWWGLPLYLVGDLVGFLGVVYYHWRRRDDGDVLNLVLRTAIAGHIYPTPIGMLACKLMNYELMHSHLTTYFERGNDHGPPMHKLWSKELLRRLF
jgi:hypothetical protein